MDWKEGGDHTARSESDPIHCKCFEVGSQNVKRDQSDPDGGQKAARGFIWRLEFHVSVVHGARAHGRADGRTEEALLIGRWVMTTG